MNNVLAFIIVFVGFAAIVVFTFYFVKMLYHYQRMIFGIKKEVYTKGKFIIGPLLLANSKYFQGDDRAAFFYYLKRLIYLSIFIGLFVLVAYYFKSKM